MKSFADWTQDLAESGPPTWLKWEEAGYGNLRPEGFMIECRVCEREFAVSEFIGPDEFDPGTPETFYCGSSPRCCP